MAESIPRSIVVLGPSGSGKSTLVNSLRSPRYSDRLTIPRRVITLPVREDSDRIENENVSAEEFRERRDRGAIRPWWTRDLGGKAVHFYGFEAVAPDEARTVVYPANDAMVFSSNGNGVQALLARSEIAMITADREDREDRLLERAPSMSPEERQARLDDQIDPFLLRGSVGIELIDTSLLSPQESRQQFLEFVLGTATAPMAPDAADGLPEAV